MAQSIDNVVARILGRAYGDDPNELAREIADGLSALSRQPSFTRGLSRDTIADIQGGTTLVSVTLLLVTSLMFWSRTLNQVLHEISAADSEPVASPESKSEPETVQP